MTSNGRRFCTLFFLAAVVLAAAPAMASHGRFGHLTWNPRPDISPTTIELTAKVAFRRSAFGAPIVGSLVNLAGSANISWGDGASSNSVIYEVLAIDTANDWMFAEARGLLHTYPATTNGGQPWIAQISNCCRIYSNRNAPGTSYRYQTTVDLSVSNSSPRSTAPPIVFMAVNTANSIVIPVAEPDGDTISCRLANFTESGISNQPGPPVSGPVNSLTVTAVPGGCQINWETTGTVINELWAVQLVIEDSRGGDATAGVGGTTLGRTALEFLIQIVGEIGEPPICDIPPSPSGTIAIADNTTFNATIQGSDPDPGETLVLNSTGVPAGASVTPGLPIVGGSPISTMLSWTPTLLDIGPQPFLFTITDSNNLQTFCQFTLDVQFDPFGGITVTPDRDINGRLRRPPTGGTDPDIEGGRCVETMDLDCAPPAGPTQDCMPDFMGVPFEDFPTDEDTLDIDITLSEGDGEKIVCCELIDSMAEISGPFCQTIELISAGCTDDDGDGYGSPGDADCPGGAAEDCDDASPAVNPGAVEICENGIDDNCDGVIDEDLDVPSISCPPDLTLECSASTDPADTGVATADDNCAVISLVPSDNVTPNCGAAQTIVRTWTATDAAGNESSCSQIIVVEDTTAPEISVALDPAVLWPPNHRMIDISSSVSVSDACTTAPTWVLTSVTSNEPDNAIGVGDGNTVNDIQGADLGTPDAGLRLRAERQGTGNGRIYTVGYSVTDECGNSSDGSGIVLVPHDQGNGQTAEPMVLAVDRDAAGTAVAWDQVPGAIYYNVVRGNLADLAETDAAIELGSLTCVEAYSEDLSTAGNEELAIPEPGEAFFYLVEYNDGWRSSYGTESAPKPRVATSGGCE